MFKLFRRTKDINEPRELTPIHPRDMFVYVADLRRTIRAIEIVDVDAKSIHEYGILKLTSVIDRYSQYFLHTPESLEIVDMIYNQNVDPSKFTFTGISTISTIPKVVNNLDGTITYYFQFGLGLNKTKINQVILIIDLTTEVMGPYTTFNGSLTEECLKVINTLTVKTRGKLVNITKLDKYAVVTLHVDEPYTFKEYIELIKGTDDVLG